MIGRGALGRRGEMEAGAGTGLADSGTAHGAFAFADEAAAAAAGRQAGGQQAGRQTTLSAFSRPTAHAAPGPLPWDQTRAHPPPPPEGWLLTAQGRPRARATDGSWIW